MRQGPGLSSRLLLSRLARGGCAPTMLMYHGTPGGAALPAPYSLHARQFLGHVEVFRLLGWPTRCVSELDNPPIGPALYITFDDGYRDNHTHALPALTEAGLRATWFVPSARVGGRADWGALSPEQQPLMSCAELNELAAAGMEIGAHSRTHADLSRLQGDALEDEVAGARRELEDLLGRPVQSFAYPFGAHTATTVEAVAAAGYTHACSTRAGRLHAGDGPWRLRRITLQAGDDADQLVRKLWLGANRARPLDLAASLLQRLRPGAGSREGGLLARDR